LVYSLIPKIKSKKFVNEGLDGNLYLRELVVRCIRCAESFYDRNEHQK